MTTDLPLPLQCSLRSGRNGPDLIVVVLRNFARNFDRILWEPGLSIGNHYILVIHYILVAGGPHGRVVKVADFSALDHSIISPMWVRASLGARVTCGTSQVLLAGVSGGFSPGTPVFAPPTD